MSEKRSCPIGHIKKNNKCIPTLRDVTVYDDGGKTVDRYTVVIQDGSVFGIGNDPFSPQGYNQYVGEISEFPKGLSHTGKKLKTNQIPEKVKLAILQRIKWGID